MQMRLSSRSGRKGQTAVEYLLATVTLVTVFAAMYGFLQNGVRDLYRSAAVKILTSYPRTSN